MEQSKFLPLVILLACSGVSKAGVTMSIDEPEYWSGTNCRVVGKAEINGTTAGIDKARIKVNGSVIWEIDYPAFPYRIKSEPVIMFDSTQYDHLASVEAKFEVLLIGSSTWSSVSHSCYAKNSAGIYTDPDLQFPAKDDLEDYFESAKYSHTVNETAWSFSSYFYALDYLTAVDLNVHGDDCVHDDGAHSDSVLPYDYSSHVASKVGSGLPPFNATKWPPLNFFHFNSCRTGLVPSVGPDWPSILHPQENSYSSGQIENQGGIAYTCYTLDAMQDEMVDALYSKLVAGYVLLASRAELVNCSEVEVRDTVSGPERLIQLSDIKTYGDTAMRLKGVYTANHTAPSSPLDRVRIISQ